MAETQTQAAQARRTLDALITAQAMEDAVRNILRPLEEIAEAFPIVQAAHACLDKQATAVDPVIDEMQRTERTAGASTSTVGQAIPSEVGHHINGELLDVITLLHAAATEAEACVPRGADDGGMTSAQSRAVTLMHLAREKAGGMVRDLEPYV